MGCGAIHSLHYPRRSRTAVRVVAPPSSSPKADSLFTRNTSKELPRARSPEDDEATDGVGTLNGDLSPSPSVHTSHSHVTSIASIPSLQTGFSSTHTGGSVRYYFKGSLFPDDTRSDVPTISESIADMQDFHDLPPTGARTSLSSTQSLYDEDHHGTWTPKGSASSACSVTHGASSASLRSTDSYASASALSIDSPAHRTIWSSSPTAVSIDSRAHPLAVLSCSNSSTQSHSDSQSCHPAVGDLGTGSDVPSIRDDMSVTSAPSEICVSFPPSIYHSENGSQTPYSERMRSLTGFGKLRRGASWHSNSRRGSRNSSLHSSQSREPRDIDDAIKENPLLTLVAQGLSSSASEATGTPRSSTPSLAPSKHHGSER